MTLAQDLAAAFAETELTVPVQLVGTGALARGFFDVGLTMVSEVGLDDASDGQVLHLMRGALGSVKVEDQIRIGALGATAVSLSDPLYVFRLPATAQDDGAFDHLLVVPVT